MVLLVVSTVCFLLSLAVGGSSSRVLAPLAVNVLVAVLVVWQLRPGRSRGRGPGRGLGTPHLGEPDGPRRW